ncbi:MAG: hypothetical protein HQ471_03915 [Flavobacteriales bacterium]|nr:hypothetical protein [Flavobacteriales bacterium]
MAKSKEITVEEKLRALYDLQLIDSKIDEIRNVRGELPLEVRDLEDDIAGLDTRLSNLNTDVENFEIDISNKKIAIEEANTLMSKYTEQQKNVRNNREFDSIAKEIEFQTLEIQLCEKRINEYSAKIAHKNEAIASTTEKLAERNMHLGHKKAELDTIIAETNKDEKLLLSKSDEFSKLIDERLLKAYSRIRKNVRNGLAVVSIERGASGGSFFTIPPQRQVEILARKKIITDEHSGRILVDSVLAEEEKAKIEALLN